MCHTHIRVVETGPRYPARTNDPIYCPVCHTIVCYKNTSCDFDESVLSLDDTLEPYKSSYVRSIEAQNAFNASLMLYNQYMETRDRNRLEQAHAKIIEALALQQANTRFLEFRDVIEAALSI